MPVIHIRKAWTETDQAQAAADGWKLEPTHFKDKYNRYKIRWFISSIDETKDDEQTINHVVTEAGKGVHEAGLPARRGTDLHWRRRVHHSRFRTR